VSLFEGALAYQKALPAAYHRSHDRDDGLDASFWHGQSYPSRNVCSSPSSRVGREQLVGAC
jgi:hypothetical protein